MKYYRSSLTSKKIAKSFKSRFDVIEEEVSLDLEDNNSQDEAKPYHEMDDLEKIDHLLQNFL